MGLPHLACQYKWHTSQPQPASPYWGTIHVGLAPAASETLWSAGALGRRVSTICGALGGWQGDHRCNCRLRGFWKPSTCRSLSFSCYLSPSFSRSLRFPFFFSSLSLPLFFVFPSPVLSFFRRFFLSVCLPDWLPARLSAFDPLADFKWFWPISMVDGASVTCSVLVNWFSCSFQGNRKTSSCWLFQEQRVLLAGRVNVQVPACACCNTEREYQNGPIAGCIQASRTMPVIRVGLSTCSGLIIHHNQACSTRININEQFSTIVIIVIIANCHLLIVKFSGGERIIHINVV